MNSAATLNCNGREFKCINATHYQPCSLTQRSGQQPQYTINGVVLPCAQGKSCDEASAFGCAAVARTAQPIDQPSQIPVQVTIVHEPVKQAAPAVVAAVVESVAAPAKALPAEQPASANDVVPADPVVAPSTEQGKKIRKKIVNFSKKKLIFEEIVYLNFFKKSNGKKQKKIPNQKDATFHK